MVLELFNVRQVFSVTEWKITRVVSVVCNQLICSMCSTSNIFIKELYPRLEIGDQRDFAYSNLVSTPIEAVKDTLERFIIGLYCASQQH